MNASIERGIFAAAIAAFAVGSPAVGQTAATRWLSRAGERYDERVSIVVENPLGDDLKSVPVTLAVSEVRKVAATFPGRGVVVVDADAPPARPWMKDAIVESQLDDLDGDGQPDELTFLAALAPGQKKRYLLYFTDDDLPAPQFARRTQITPFATDPNSYFAVESDLFLFRFAKEAGDRPAPVGDMFAKRAPGYTQHLYYARTDLWDYMRDSAIGRCILAPWDYPGQPGIGAISAKTGKGYVAPTNARVAARIVSNGPIRSIGAIELTDWNLDGRRIAVCVLCSMYAGQRYLQYDVTIRSEGRDPPNAQFCLGLPKLDNETKDADAGAGRLLLWGDRRKPGVDGVGAGIILPPSEAAGVEAFEQGHAVVLKAPPQPTEPLRVRAFLVGAWKGADPFRDAAQFFEEHRRLAQRLQTPPRCSIEGAQSRPVQTATLAGPTPDRLFIANPSNLRSVLPAELDLGAWGFRAGANSTGQSDEKPVDVVELYGTTKAFIDGAVDPLKTATVRIPHAPRDVPLTRSVRSTSSPASGIDVRENQAERQIEVSTGRAKWLVDGSGLRRVTLEGKKLLLEPSVQNGTASVAYSGKVVAIVRVGNDRGFVDYCFFKDRDIVKVVSSQPYALSNPKLRSCVAKKEVGVDGCEQYEVNAWGRVATDAVFQSTELSYPAEWGAIYSEDPKCGLVVYGSPSAARIAVKRGRFEAPLGANCRRLELYLAVVDDPASGEELFPVMSSPMVLCPCGDGFAAREDRNGNGIADVVYVRDENADGRPDFDGDRWHFDVDDDGTLQMVLAFGTSPRTMRVYCDTVTGGPLHSNNLAAYFGDYPTDRYRFARYPQSRDKFDGCLSPWELQEPFHVYTDVDGDGAFFKGPVTEGGFVGGDCVTSAWGGPYLYEMLARNCTLDCTDLDGDRDADIWSVDWFLENSARDMALVHGDGRHGPWYRRREGHPDRAVFLIHFDLSDNNLEPVTVVSPYSGRAYWATRYYSMVLADNGKTFQQGRLEDGVIVGGQNWPAVGTWDVDNDGLADAHIFVEYQNSLGLDLEKRRKRDDPAVRDRHAFQRDVFYEEQTLPCNFGLLVDNLERRQSEPPHMFFPPSAFALSKYRDPHGKTVAIRAPFLPEEWYGEGLPCKKLGDGQLDYIAKHNWDWCLNRAYPFVAVYHWRPGLFRLCHEGVWDQMHFNPQTRIEIDADGTSSFALYHSPVIGGLHFRGLTFGLQFMHDQEPHEAVARHQRIYYDPQKPLFVGEYMHPREQCNDYPAEVRQYGTMLLYYRDRDKDGYADTYVLDDDNDGLFEKRIWLDTKTSTVGLYDKGQIAFVARRIELPERELSLKNYEDLVRMYHQGRERPGWLKEMAIGDGKVTDAGDDLALVLPAEWLPRVAVDAFHAGQKPLWADFGPPGLDTLARVASESAVQLSAFNEAYTPASLAPCDVLVIARWTSKPTLEEIQALADHVENGGCVVVLAGNDDEIAASARDKLLTRFGLKAERADRVEVLPNMPNFSEVLAGAKDGTGGTLLRDVAPLVLTAHKAGYGKDVKPLLEYGGAPIIVEKQVGKGRVIVVASDVFENQRMRLPREMRVQPFKPGNQSLAANLIAYLVGKREPKVEFTRWGPSGATARIRGKGGPVYVNVPWKTCKVQVDGIERAAAAQDGPITLSVPAGECVVELSP